MKEQTKEQLIWKYFWKRKREEIRPFIFSVTFIQMISLASTALILMAPRNNGLEPINSYLGGIFLWIVFIELIAVIIFILVIWLHSNWKLATEDANRELTERSRETRQPFLRKRGVQNGNRSRN